MTAKEVLDPSLSIQLICSFTHLSNCFVKISKEVPYDWSYTMNKNKLNTWNKDKIDNSAQHETGKNKIPLKLLPF